MLRSIARGVGRLISRVPGPIFFACILAWTSAARALELPDYLAQVQAGNPMLASRDAMAKAAGQRVSRAGAWDNPMLEVGAVNVPSNGRFDMEPMTMTMVGVAQKFPLFGARGLARKAARGAADAAASGVENARYELIGMAWENFADARASSELVRAAQDHRAFMHQLAQAARSRVASGNGRLDDALRAEAEEARVLASVSDYRAESIASWARLQSLRGLDPSATMDSLAPVPLPAVSPDPSAWLAAISGNHPRLRELNSTADRYRLEARSARRMFWPDLELRGSYGWRRTLADGQAQDNMFSAMAAIMIPIFYGQREGAEAAEMETMARAASEERVGAQLDLQGEVLSAHSSAVAAQRNLQLLADTVLVLQRRAVEASWSAYRTGATDLWRVFEAGHALYDEELALIRARQTLARAEARLVARTGRTDLLGVALPPWKE